MKSLVFAAKKKIAPALHWVSHVSGNSFYQSTRKRAIRVFMFHGIGGKDCPTDIFIKQMEYLARYYSVISLKMAIEMISNNDYSVKNEIVLTFDDGLKNNLNIAYPVLLRFGLPATFFVCPGLIDSGKWLWAYEVERRLLTLEYVKLTSFCKDFDITSPKWKPGNNVCVVEHIIEFMKTLATSERMSLESTIQELTTEFEPTKEDMNMLETMNWDELCSLSSELITIGSHTLNHPILTKLPVNDICFEIQESRYILERKLKKTVEYFCYPNGDFNDEVLKVVRETYAAAVTTEQGFFTRGDDVFKICRIPAASDMPLFAWRLFRPSS